MSSHPNRPRHVEAVLAKYSDALRNLGITQTLHYALQRARIAVGASTGIVEVRSKHSRHTLTCRVGTSDIEVFGQVFVHREYQCLDQLDTSTIDFIIDCGANVGFSSAYFMTRFPKSTVLAVEPSTGNFERLAHNLRPFGTRARMIKGGVWWRDSGLMVTDGDGTDWSRGVREVLPGENADTVGFDIGSLIEQSGFARVSLLKIDIEGSELEIFSRPCPWLSKVDHLVIETHGDECENAVRAACAAHGLALERYNDELMVGHRS